MAAEAKENTLSGAEELAPEAQVALVQLRQYEGDAEGFGRAAREALNSGVPTPIVDFLRLQFAIFDGDAELLETAIDQAVGNRAGLDRFVGGPRHCSAYLALANARLAEARQEPEKVKLAYMEAFWASPQEASLAARFAANYQRAQLLAGIRIPLDIPLREATGGTTTLAALMEGRKAVLIDFWASWCGPCIQMMPELKRLASHLESQDIGVVALNVGETPAEAEPVREEFDMKIPWLLDTEDQRINSLIQNDAFPHQLLVDPEGRILFDGHPADPALGTALATLGVEPAP